VDVAPPHRTPYSLV